MMTPEDQRKHDKFVAWLTEGNTHLAGLFDQCVGRVMKRSAKQDGRWKEPSDLATLRHIVDWLIAAVINDDEWLERLDEHGRVKKLMKFSSIEQIAKEADKAMLKAVQKGQGINLLLGDEELETKLSGGFYVVRLLTPQALDRESALMQHCIGAGSYDNKLASKSTAFFSLRDAVGKPHVTMEVKNGTVLQIQGKQNRPPVSRYMEAIKDFCQSRQYQVDVPCYQLGYLIDTDSQWHPLNLLPDGLTVEGEVDLRGVEIDRLPKDMTVKGSLYISQTQITEIPERLTVEGHLDLSTTTVERILPGLKVKRDLSIILNPTVKALPDNVEVGGNLVISFGNLEKIGCNLSVGGDLKIRGAHLEMLENVRVGRHLEIRDCNMELSGSLEVGGNLSIDASRITKLPDNMAVKGGLSVSRTPLKSFPKTAKIGGRVDMIMVEIAAMPDNMSFNDTISITYTPLETLPKNLKVKGDLNLIKTNIFEIPKDLKVGGSLFLSGTKIKTLPKNLHVEGDLSLLDTPIQKLPDGLRVGGRLDIRRSAITEIPDDIRVGHTLDIRETAIKEVPITIPDDVEVKGTAWMC